ncbi:MAG: peptidoglycan DD-metalloendopeptidase family protein [Paludibacteraceae bacterium]|jgi:septal ring factor EnvC (AmiA/AmiB activator)|nr:peptidoglycan DD-metalloendopeptidase family protein [Paludibacteraceae bacterium]MDI9536370.1 peptidoglycan DD-metalloendopeptidase family protein [Bacteroidota bacterium]OQC34172.1 MAG: AmiB activator [Bacteroidetes bacterium ADurb.Bin057]HHT60957.1 peptidoglycan DD-metalloendopeptidase family protein [Bacteroidales bacterium]MBP9039165.1 peptidoglycan DD-metalloendopeptidase family protein [Paludibacteraceae bacterium]
MQRFFCFSLLVLLCSSLCFGQSIKELERRKKQAMEQLALTNKLLEETKKSKQSSVNKINILKRNIRERQAYINSLSIEIDTIEKNITGVRTEKTALEKKLNTVKQEYTELIRATNIRRKHFSPILFVFSASNFSEAFRRFRYLQEFSNYRKKQVAEMQNLTAQLAAKEQDLITNLSAKEQVMNSKTKETKKLQTDQAKENKMYASLKQKEQKLKKDQKAQQKRANELNARIQKLIAEEIKKEEERARQKASQEGKQETAPQYVMSKEEQLIAGNFEKNKGKLPLPVEKGFVSGNFGIQPHPVLSHVTTNNKGIYIQTPSGSDARAIFEGVVTQRFMVPGSNSAVIVKHGIYRSVYTNLTEIYVKEGDKLSTKQKIGKIFTDTENENKTELYLMIYKNTSIENPELWLAL